MGNSSRDMLVKKEGDQEKNAIHDDRGHQQDKDGAQPSVQGNLREGNQVQRAGHQPAYCTHSGTK